MSAKGRPEREFRPLGGSAAAQSQAWGDHTSAADSRPLIAHVVYRFDIGGLENGVVNLLNRLPRERWRHAVVALTEATSFRARVQRDDVRFVELHKGPGHGITLLPRLTRILRGLSADIVHTRNLAALEASPAAWLAGVPIRVHGEHGRDVGDLDGSSRTYRLVRRAYRPFVSHYVSVSRDLERYLVDAVGVAPARVTRIVNGVDTDAFHPANGEQRPDGCPFTGGGLWLIGTVGRLQAVKHQVLLARAFVRMLERSPGLRERIRLVIVGDGPLLPEIRSVLAAGSAQALAWLPGARNDVPAILRGLDVFVLPSLAEGISNTILEAMASGLPVVATDVGGNAELVANGETGTIVPADDADALAEALLAFARDADAAHAAGRAARARAERLFSLDAMVAQYAALYERLLRGRKSRAAAGSPLHATTGTRS